MASPLNYAAVITGLFFESPAGGAKTRGMTWLRVHRAECGADTDVHAVAAQGGELTPELCRLGRTKLGWSVETLAAAAGLAPQTIVQFEAAGCRPRPGTVIALRKALRSAGAFAAGERGGRP